MMTEPWATNVIGLAIRMGPVYMPSGIVKNEPGSAWSICFCSASCSINPVADTRTGRSWKRMRKAPIDKRKQIDHCFQPRCKVNPPSTTYYCGAITSISAHDYFQMTQPGYERWQKTKRLAQTAWPNRKPSHALTCGMVLVYSVCELAIGSAILARLSF